MHRFWLEFFRLVNPWLEVPDWSLAFWSWFGYSPWALIDPWSKFWLSKLILKVQRTQMSFESWYGVLEDAVYSWLKFCILIMICFMFGYSPWAWIDPWAEFWPSKLILMKHRTSMSLLSRGLSGALSPDFRLWRLLKVPDHCLDIVPKV